MTIHLIERVAECVVIALILRAVFVYRNPFRRLGPSRYARRLGARQVHAARVIIRAIWRSR